MKIFKDRSKIPCKDPQGSSFFLPRSLRILKNLAKDPQGSLRIFKDYKRSFEDLVKIFVDSLLILPKIFKDLQ